MEVVCPECIHRNSFGLPAEVVDKLSYNLSNPDDLAAIERSPHAAAIKHALAQPRPERCVLLREILPPVEVTELHRPLAACPEIGLANLVGDEEAFATSSFRP